MRAWRSSRTTRLIVGAVLGMAWATERPSRGQEKDPSLVGAWSFSQGSGAVAKDASGHGHDGAINEGTWVTGDFGTALHFNGESTYVTIPAIPALDGSDQMTVSVWVFWEGVGRYPNILTGGAWNPGGFLIFVGDDRCSFRLGRPGKEAWELGKDWQETQAVLLQPIRPGRWVHLAATVKRPDMTTYVNGEPVGAVRWNHPVGQTGEIIVGRWNLDQGETQSHYGMIDELRLHSRALSPAEIRAEFGRTRQGRQ
ncbi:MAG: LamG domain-containing protein [Lentisphaerae bacterium]|jgi:hypothetical protein|nr:LamG domain-containing protein [Lentisphaerota bacterium]MBT4817657.1 LamG domain-containing protein [Lentisphaerota bacterium]MBT5605051.1 LamG domain-containing protein [Lentisphaerota bacterium]MBT7058673.1 LamG domain-containing protein [Lentisphaerota bacterium]MBT7847014.1 LamG domain-containing protein [Lentisphaerota bacterium]